VWGACFDDQPELEYVGNGRGNYQAEVNYKYVGNGAGDFDLTPKGGLGVCYCSLCGILSIICLVLFHYGPKEDFMAAVRRHVHPTRQIILEPTQMPSDDLPWLQTSVEPYNCDLDFTNCYHCLEKRWSRIKLGWCCDHHGKGCPTTSTAVQYDCNAGFVNWEAGWSRRKKNYCCLHEQRACPEPMTTSCPFDCEAGVDNWEAGWSLPKKTWCCAHEFVGCPPTSPPFDCGAGAANWEAGWSLPKKRWCCAHASVGCHASPAPYR